MSRFNDDAMSVAQRREESKSTNQDASQGNEFNPSLGMANVEEHLEEGLETDVGGRKQGRYRLGEGYRGFNENERE